VVSALPVAESAGQGWLQVFDLVLTACGSHNEPSQRCRSKVRTAAAIDDIRFGLYRALRKIRHDFIRATARGASGPAKSGTAVYGS